MGSLHLEHLRLSFISIRCIVRKEVENFRNKVLFDVHLQKQLNKALALSINFVRSGCNVF